MYFMYLVPSLLALIKYTIINTYVYLIYAINMLSISKMLSNMLLKVY